MSVTRTMVCRYFIGASPRSEHLRGSGGFDVHLVARGDVLAGDHLIVALPGAYHRIDARLGVDHHLEEGGTRERQELADHPWYVRLVLEARGVGEPVGLRRLDEVFFVQRAIARRQPAFEEQLLPLLNHAVAEIVEHHDLHRQAVGARRLELADVHANAGVAVNVYNQALRTGDLRADGRREAKAHGAHAAGGEPQARRAEVAVLRGPHLVLADAGGDDRLAARQAVELLEHVVRLDERARPIVIHGVGALKLGDVRGPGAEVAPEPRAAPVRSERLERLAHQAHVTPLYALDLVDLGAVDVEVHDAARIAREFLRHPRHPVVEARTDRDQEVTVLDRVVGKRRAVHAEHAQRQGVGGVERTDAHQGRHHRDAEGGGELSERAGGVAVHDAASGIDERLLGLAEHREEAHRRLLLERGYGQLVHPTAVARNRQDTRPLEDLFRVLNVFGNVHDHGAGTPRTGDLEGRTDRCFELGRIRHEEDMLRDGAHDRWHRGFLEGVGSDGWPGDLARNDDNRHRIRHAVAHWRNSIGRAGTRGDEAHPHPPAGPGIAGRHEPRALLVRRNYEGDLGGAAARALLVVEEDRVVGRQDRPAAIAEDGGDPLVSEHLHDHARTAHPDTGERMSRRSWLDHRIVHRGVVSGSRGGVKIERPNQPSSSASAVHTG